MLKSVDRTDDRQITVLMHVKLTVYYNIFTLHIETNVLNFVDVFAVNQLIGVESHSESCVDVKAGTSVKNCTNYYLNQTTLSFEPTIQNCSVAYMEANEMLSSVCNQLNDTYNCKVNLSEIISEYPTCFQSSTLRVDYSCECKCLYYCSFIKEKH
jgi:hypothetical protein